MPGQKPRPDDVMADAPCHLRQAGGLQVESLSRLHCTFGAAAVAHGDAVGALQGQQIHNRQQEYSYITIYMANEYNYIYV